MIDLFKGDLGQMEGGFPEALSKIILKGDKPMESRPNQYLDPVDFDTEFVAFQQEFDDTQTMLDFLSYKMYPEVFKDFYNHKQEYGEISYLPTNAFFYGLQPEEEISVEIGKGKVIIIRLLFTSEPGEDGMRTVTFDLNGQTRTVRVRDTSVVSKTQVNTKASDEHEIGAPLQGKLSDVIAHAGDQVTKGDPLFVIEAMKMETTVTAPFDGSIKKIHLQAGELVQQDDLIVEFK